MVFSECDNDETEMQQQDTTIDDSSWYQDTTIDDSSWYSSLYKEHAEEFENIESGGKLAVLFEILYLAKRCDDKV